MKNIRYTILFGMIGLLSFYFIYVSLSQPGVADLKTQFEENSLYRNEHNTGPIVRKYIIAVNDSLWTDLEAYAEFQPHTKYGTTEVYFFMKDQKIPSKALGTSPPFASEFEAFCIAKYSKNNMSQTSFVKYPFR